MVQYRGSWSVHYEDLKNLVSKLTNLSLGFLEANHRKMLEQVVHTIQYIQYTIEGRVPALAVVLRQMLEDNAYFPKLRKVQQHLGVAQTALDQGASPYDLETWLSYGLAKDGVVGSLTCYRVLLTIYTKAYANYISQYLLGPHSLRILHLRRILGTIIILLVAQLTIRVFHLCRCMTQTLNGLK